MATMKSIRKLIDITFAIIRIAITKEWAIKKSIKQIPKLKKISLRAVTLKRSHEEKSIIACSIAILENDHVNSTKHNIAFWVHQ
jgi:hypothetical protein